MQKAEAERPQEDIPEDDALEDCPLPGGQQPEPVLGLSDKQVASAELQLQTQLESSFVTVSR